MFRRQENTLEADARYPADLEKLGHFVDKNGCIRRIDAPELYFDFHYTNNDRHNEVRGEAMRVCQRREVMNRLSALGLQQLYLPTLSNDRPDGPHIPILAPAKEVLKTRKRVIVIINDDTYQDLGILAYRELQREGGVNGGSVVNFAKRLASSPMQGIKNANGNEKLDKDDLIPGLIVLNTGQLLYSHKLNKALSMRSWTALPRKSITHDPVKIHEVENRVEGHRTPAEHIKTVFDTVIKNPQFVSPEAEIYVVAIENGVEALVGYLHEDFYDHVDRITALAAMQSSIGGHQIHNPDVKAFLHTRARHWETSPGRSSDPNQCNAVPSGPFSTAVPEPCEPYHEEPIDWLENVDGDSEVQASISFANIREAKAAIADIPEPSSEDGFLDATPICPTFGGGDTWVGECVFTQSSVQEAVIRFFEDVARDPREFCNLNLSQDGLKTSYDGFNALSAGSQPGNLPDDLLTPEKKAIVEMQEELRQLQVALDAIPQDNPSLTSGVLRLRNLIKKKEARLKTLEEKAIAAGGLGAGSAQELRDTWGHAKDGEEWTEVKPGAPIPFAGVQADSNVVASAGCLKTVEEELAKLELEDD